MNKTTKLPKNNRELKAVTNPMAVIALNSLIGGTVRINRAIANIKDFISSFGKAFFKHATNRLYTWLLCSLQPISRHMKRLVC